MSGKKGKCLEKNKPGRPEAITPELRKEIAELMFLGFTDSQIGTMTKISERTIKRARLGEYCLDIIVAALRREIPYRRKVWSGKLGWQGAAWMLERRYPGQFCRPEVALQITNQIGPQTQNVVILTNKSSIEVNERNKVLEAEVTEMLQLSSNGSGPLSSRDPAS